MRMWHCILKKTEEIRKRREKVSVLIASLSRFSFLIIFRSFDYLSIRVITTYSVFKKIYPLSGYNSILLCHLNIQSICTRVHKSTLDKSELELLTTRSRRQKIRSPSCEESTSTDRVQRNTREDGGESQTRRKKPCEVYTPGREARRRGATPFASVIKSGNSRGVELMSTDAPPTSRLSSRSRMTCHATPIARDRSSRAIDRH